MSLVDVVGRFAPAHFRRYQRFFAVFFVTNGTTTCGGMTTAFALASFRGCFWVVNVPSGFGVIIGLSDFGGFYAAHTVLARLL
jgi:hypothetical protein